MTELIGVISIAGKPIGTDDEYERPYTIIPLAFQSQTFETENKMMTSDLTVREIPYLEAPNTSGLTITIGGH